MRMMRAVLLYALVRLPWRTCWTAAEAPRPYPITCREGFLYIAPRLSPRYRLRELVRFYCNECHPRSMRRPT